jgi:CubicO group peptidase (beta-lactamase class C family)
LTVNSDELGDLLSRQAEAWGVAGAAIGVVKDGETVTAYAGLADEESRTPVSSATHFLAGSLSKSMVATVIARLVGQGRFDFDDSIGSLVPELSESAWGDQITVRHLLAQTALVQPPPVEALAHIDQNDENCFSAACSLLADQPLRSEPGKTWSYGGGWIQLARLIEVATSTPWAQAMRSELFEPLAMSSTAWSPELDPATWSDHYSIEGGKRTRIDQDPEFEVRFVGPAGGIRTTIDDLLTFGRAHVDRTGSYCDPSHLAALRERQTAVAVPSYLDGWCLGWGFFDWEGGPVWGWEGIATGHRAMLRLLPDQRGAIAQVANTTSGRGLYRSLFPGILDRYFGVEMPPVIPMRALVAADKLSRFEGTYGWPGLSVDVEAQEGHIVVRMPDETIDAVPVGDAWFLKDPDDPDHRVAFTFKNFDADGRAQLMYSFLHAFPRRDA